MITALTPCKATISVKAGTKTQKFVLTVGSVAASKIVLNQKTASLGTGKKLTLSVKAWTPVNADPKTLTWTSSDPAIAKVNKNGVVTGVSVGKVTITATTWNGKTAKCAVTVK